jgi:hypothetical protein
MGAGDFSLRMGDRARGITNYLTFLDAIGRWRYENTEQVYFVTFNYDTMLEASMAELWGRKFTDFKSYTSPFNTS